MQARLSKIDELTRPDHTFLLPEDQCYFLGEYTARKGFGFSATNNLINNLKKPMDRKGKHEWRYKEDAIRRAAELLRAAIRWEWLATATLVPMPPSKTRAHPDYDDRLLRMLKLMARGDNLDIREVLVMREDADAAHLKDAPRSIARLTECMTVDCPMTEPAPQVIGLIDDVLTTGAHFKAAQSILNEVFPGVPIVGVFLARRVPEAMEI